MKLRESIAFAILIVMCSQAKCQEFVDLGLPSGNKWATCNVGATSPQELGNYYAWGEINPKHKYKPGNYKYFELSVFKNPNLFGTGLEKYAVSKYGILSSEYDIVFDKFNDGKMILESADDVANLEYGHGWSMPTILDYEELFENCKCDRIEIDGIRCIRLTSKISGYENSIIVFPISGIMNHHSFKASDNTGHILQDELYCWTSCLSEDLNSKHAVAIHVNEKSEIDHFNTFRYYGMQIRAVYKE